MVLTHFPSGPLKPINTDPLPVKPNKKEQKAARRAIGRVKRRRPRSTFRWGRKAHNTDKREYYRTVYLKSDHWKGLREAKLKVNPCCEMCGSAKRVEPHHLRYKNLYDVEVADLQTLCRPCHILVHKRIDASKGKGKLLAFDKSEQGTSRPESGQANSGSSGSRGGSES